MKKKKEGSEGGLKIYEYLEERPRSRREIMGHLGVSEEQRTVQNDSGGKFLSGGGRKRWKVLGTLDELTKRSRERSGEEKEDSLVDVAIKGEEEDPEKRRFFFRRKDTKRWEKSKGQKPLISKPNPEREKERRIFMEEAEEILRGNKYREKRALVDALRKAKK